MTVNTEIKFKSFRLNQSLPVACDNCSAIALNRQAFDTIPSTKQQQKP